MEKYVKTPFKTFQTMTLMCLYFFFCLCFISLVICKPVEVAFVKHTSRRYEDTQHASWLVGSGMYSCGSNLPWSPTSHDSQKLCMVNFLNIDYTPVENLQLLGIRAEVRTVNVETTNTIQIPQREWAMSWFLQVEGEPSLGEYNKTVSLVPGDGQVSYFGEGNQKFSIANLWEPGPIQQWLNSSGNEGVTKQRFENITVCVQFKCHGYCTSDWVLNFDYFNLYLQFNTDHPSLETKNSDSASSSASASAASSSSSSFSSSIKISPFFLMILYIVLFL